MFLWRVRGKPYCEHDRLGELCVVVPSAAAAAFLHNIHVGKGGLTREIFLGRRHLVPLLPLVISLFLVPAVRCSSLTSVRAGSI